MFFPRCTVTLYNQAHVIKHPHNESYSKRVLYVSKMNSLSPVLLCPQVFLAGVSIGGSDALLTQMASGAFQQKLADALASGAAALPDDLAVLQAEEQQVAASKVSAGAGAAKGEVIC